MRLSAAVVCFVGVVLGALPATAQSSGGFRTNAVPDASGNLTGRVEKLEEQVVDLQGVVAGVETMAKNGGGSSSGGSVSPASSGGASSDQVRQLSAQIADLTARLQRLEAQLGNGSASARPSSSFATTAPASGFEDRQQLPPVAGRGSQPVPAPLPVEGETRPSRQTAAADPAPLRPAGPSSSGAQSLYDQGSSALSRKEYSAAEGYFNQLLEQYPSDAKAGLAQFWLGEAAFASGEYKTAADRFLKAFNNYQSSEKAPEALLKLAISLRRIGESTAACESFAELQKRFPQASKSITQRAETEKRRANCT